MKAHRIATVIGQGTEIQGDISFTGGLHIDGTVKGSVMAVKDDSAMLSLSDLGVIEGEVRVPTIILNGTVRGNVHAAEKIELAPSSKIIGDVTYNLIEMAIGAAVNGNLIHKKAAEAELAPRTPPVPRLEEKSQPALIGSEKDEQTRSKS